MSKRKCISRPDAFTVETYALRTPHSQRRNIGSQEGIKDLWDNVLSSRLHKLFQVEAGIALSQFTHGPRRVIFSKKRGKPPRDAIRNLARKIDKDIVAFIVGALEALKS